MGILDGIVEWIAEQVMAGLDLITTSVLIATTATTLALLIATTAFAKGGFFIT